MADIEIHRLTLVAEVLDAVYQNALAAADRDRRQVDRIKSQIADLNDTHQRQHSQRLSANDAALQAGIDPLWQLWVDQRREALNVELARASARAIETRTALGKALGRKEAASRLIELRSRKLSVVRNRRATYET